MSIFFSIQTVSPLLLNPSCNTSTIIWFYYQFLAKKFLGNFRYVTTWKPAILQPCSAFTNIINQYFATAGQKPRIYVTLVLTSARWDLDLETAAEINGRRSSRRVVLLIKEPLLFNNLETLHYTLQNLLIQ